MKSRVVVLDPRRPDQVLVGDTARHDLRPAEWDLLCALADGLCHGDDRLYWRLFGERMPEPGALYSHASRLKRELGPVLTRVHGRGLRVADGVLVVVPHQVDIAAATAAFGRELERA